MYSSAQKIPKADPYPKEYRQLERNLSEVRDRKSNDQGYFKSNEKPAPNPERQMEGYKLPSINQNPVRAKVDTNLGSNFDHAPRSENILQRKQGFERYRVYEGQQKPYNIISCYPNAEM